MIVTILTLSLVRRQEDSRSILPIQFLKSGIPPLRLSQNAAFLLDRAHVNVLDSYEDKCAVEPKPSAIHPSCGPQINVMDDSGCRDAHFLVLQITKDRHRYLLSITQSTLRRIGLEETISKI